MISPFKLEIAKTKVNIHVKVKLQHQCSQRVIMVTNTNSRYKTPLNLLPPLLSRYIIIHTSFDWYEGHMAVPIAVLV